MLSATEQKCLSPTPPLLLVPVFRIRGALRCQTSPRAYNCHRGYDYGPHAQRASKLEATKRTLLLSHSSPFFFSGDTFSGDRHLRGLGTLSSPRFGNRRLVKTQNNRENLFDTYRGNHEEIRVTSGISTSERRCRNRYQCQLMRIRGRWAAKVPAFSPLLGPRRSSGSPSRSIGW